MSVTDRPEYSGDPNSVPAITLAITIEKRADGEPFTAEEVKWFWRGFKQFVWNQKADFYGVFGGDVPRKFHPTTLPEPYSEPTGESQHQGSGEVTG